MTPYIDPFSGHVIQVTPPADDEEEREHPALMGQVSPNPSVSTRRRRTG